jgi:hypothetical protein
MQFVRGEPPQTVPPLDGILGDKEMQAILANDDVARDTVIDLVVANGRGGVPGLFGGGGIPGLPRELADAERNGNGSSAIPASTKRPVSPR